MKKASLTVHETWDIGVQTNVSIKANEVYSEPALVTMAPHGIRAIPSLDGLRAFSVLGVILGHTVWPTLDRIPASLVLRKAELDVNVFFVISGFLITHLLLKELKRDGHINLKRFYFRRSFRIFPPFYVFLLIVALLRLPDVTSRLLLCAGTYTWNYFAQGACWVLGHCWTLAVEEQFYLVWPACMAYCGRVRSLWIAVGMVVISPVLRVASYYPSSPATRTRLPVMTHLHMDPIMVGCALALMIDMDKWKQLRAFLMSPVMTMGSLFYLLVVDTYATHRYQGAYLLSVGFTLQGIALASILLFAVFHHTSALGRLLNFAPLRHIGMISYSLYLWQQLFTGPRTHGLPLNWLWIFLCAELSYYLVERPSFRLRDWLEGRWHQWSRSRGALAGPAS